MSTTPQPPYGAFDPLKKLSKDLRVAAMTLSQREARYLVDSYYIWQDSRKRAASQIAAMEKWAKEHGIAVEPHSVIDWVGEESWKLETSIKSALQSYAESKRTGKWALSIVGIGPVISAGLLAHIEIEKAPTVGHIWRFAGLDPTVKWAKKTKRPWNAGLKVLCFHIGESFVKQKGRDSDFYGHLFTERKAIEEANNQQGKFADQAAAILASKNIGKETDAYAAYSKGLLPPAHVHARAKRWTVKLFLAHWHEVAYRYHHGKMPPRPYVLEFLGHAHKIEVPNYPWSQ